ncbi:FAD linked oxidase domain protein [Beutenbergia cavernae DSM 12333]|uniref:FAD linked oxidase domain protein n=2 Tax=Beutenbergia TaxID=84756 RepID=C5BXQ0_BEUC1|nr:FAD linked oxidase domain protein [Beutenbergia cavernae DSM 12333]
MRMTSQGVQELTDRTIGAVHERGDAGLAGSFPIQNTLFSVDPDVVVEPAAEGDVVAAVRFAAAQDLPIRVVATGHGIHADLTGGLLVSTGGLGGVSVDPATRIARVGAGTRWADVIAAGAPHGLLPIAGASGHVGTVGLVAGGGLGPLSASHGAASDYARAFRVVLADGSVVDVDASTHPDLFWALRGGKGPFGVVVSMDVELVPLARLYGGVLFFDAPHIEAALTAWVDWLEHKPADMSTSVANMALPPLPFVPEPLRGRTVLAVRVGYPGSEEDGAAALAPLRAAAPLHLDLVGEMPASAVGSIHNDPEDPGPAWIRGGGLTAFGQDAASRLLELVGPGTDTPFVVTEIRAFGAAWAGDVAGGSAVGGRSAPFSVAHIGPDPTRHDAMAERADAVAASLAGWRAPETNINFVSGAFTAEKAALAWAPEVRERLAGVRREHDPDARFGFPL